MLCPYCIDRTFTHTRRLGLQLLSHDQQDHITKCLKNGLTDPATAATIGTVTTQQVFNFRRSQHISAGQVLENRYTTWITLIEAGISLDVIAAVYNVKPRSIKHALWTRRQYSFMKVREQVREARQQHLAAEIQDLKRILAGDG